MLLSLFYTIVAIAILTSDCLRPSLARGRTPTSARASQRRSATPNPRQTPRSRTPNTRSGRSPSRTVKSPATRLQITSPDACDDSLKNTDDLHALIIFQQVWILNGDTTRIRLTIFRVFFSVVYYISWSSSPIIVIVTLARQLFS